MAAAGSGGGGVTPPPPRRAVLVTGAGGFIGGALVARLAADPALAVHATYRRPPAAAAPVHAAAAGRGGTGAGGADGADIVDGGPAGGVTDFAAVRTELAAFCYDNGSPGVMPTAAELGAAGRRDLVRGMARYGGLKAVADRLGWVRVSLSGVEARRRALRVAAQPPPRP